MAWECASKEEEPADEVSVIADASKVAVEKEEDQKKKRDAEQKQVERFLRQSEGTQDLQDNQYADDGLPFACHICRSFFKNPVKTNCGHYFCEKCLLDKMKANGTICPICSKDTAGVYHEPTKLLNKKH